MAIVELAERKGHVLSLFTALTYDLDPLISWRAFEALGLAATPWIIPCLENPNSQTRGLAAWAAGALLNQDTKTLLKKLTADSSDLNIYLDRQLMSCSVAELATSALKKQ